MAPHTAARRRRQRENKRSARNRQGGIFDVSLRPPIPIDRQGRRPIRRKPVDTPDLGGLNNADHIAQIHSWLEKGWHYMKANANNLSPTFHNFIAMPGYYHIWRSAFHKRNPELAHLSRSDEDGFFARSAIWHWRSWAVSKRDEEIFEENGWDKGEEGEMQALMMVLKQIFAAELETEADQIISSKVESTAQTLNHLGVRGPSGQGEEKEEALGMLECLNAFGMNTVKDDVDMGITEQTEEAEMDDMEMVE